MITPAQQRGTRYAWAVVLLGALGWVAWPASAPALDLVVVGGEGWAAALDAGSGEATAQVHGGVASPDGSVLVSSAPLGGQTLLTAVDAATGIRRWERTVDGTHAVRLVAPDGQTVVLGPDDGGGGVYAPVGRTQTTLVVSSHGGRVQSHDLAGNFEPEALSADRTSLFVISYIPPEAPERYQVRRLDLRTGEVVEVFTPDAELQQEMGGTARTQLWAPDGNRLYTLYTLGGADGQRAFVHVLDLVGLWAHCVDLPEGIGVRDEQAIAMSVTDDGSRLYVADLAAGRVVEVDTAHLETVQVAPMGRRGPGVTDVSAAVLSDGRLVVAAGTTVRTLAADTLGTQAVWEAPAVVAGLQPSGRDVLAVLRTRRVVVVDPLTGQERRTFTVPGADVIDWVGTPSVPAPDIGKDIPCAC